MLNISMLSILFATFGFLFQLWPLMLARHSTPVMIQFATW